MIKSQKKELLNEDQDWVDLSQWKFCRLHWKSWLDMDAGAGDNKQGSQEDW